MKTIKLKSNILLPAGNGKAKTAKKNAVVEVEDDFAASLIKRKLAEEVKLPPAATAKPPAPPAAEKPLDKPTLMAMTKPALLALAVTNKVAGVDDSNTKDQIADAILAATPAK